MGHLNSGYSRASFLLFSCCASYCSSYKKSQRVKESKKDNQTALQLPETSLTDAIEEETKRASKALILQKVKNMKVKKLLTTEKEIYPKIEMIGSPPISNNTESDGIYASQRLKNPAPGRSMNPVKRKCVSGVIDRANELIGSVAERVNEASFLRRPWLHDLGSTRTLVTLLCPWIRRFTMTISGWWLRTSSKFIGQNFEETHRNIGSLETPEQVGIPPSTNFCS